MPTSGPGKIVEVDNLPDTYAPRWEFVVDATPNYAALDQIGARLEITNAAKVSGGGGIIDSITVINKANLKVNMTFLIFSSDPTSAIDNNLALALSAADQEKLIASFTMAGGRYKFAGGATVGSMPLGYDYQCDGGTSLWVVGQAEETINFTATDNLHVILGMHRD